MKFFTAYEQSKNAVFAYLTYMTKDVQLAEDLSQETFLKMFIHIRNFKGTANVKTWALKIARNTFLTYARKKQPVLLEEQELDLNSGPCQNEPEMSFLQKEKAEMIKKSFLCAREHYRQVIITMDYVSEEIWSQL